MRERSYLFVPGDRPERYGKALTSGAHAVVLDLEDAVLPDNKPAAREAMRAWLAQPREAGVLVRINPAGTPWHADDCGLLRLPGVRGAMVPKAQDAAELAAVAAHLGDGRHMVGLVETVAGWAALRELAGAPRMARFAFGSVDFMLDAGITGDAEELDAVRTALVLESKLAGLAAPVEGVTLAIGDEARLQADVRRARRFGMGGKLCIHPSQVAAVNAGFAPGEAETAWARRVIQAIEARPAGAVAVDGKLVDKPIVMQARAVLAQADENSGYLAGQSAAPISRSN